MSAELTGTSTPLSEITRRREARRYSLIVVACAAALGLLAGFYAARSGVYRVATLDRASTSDVEALTSLDAWLAKVATTVGKNLSPALRQQLTLSITGSETLRREVIEHYGREARRPHRVAILRILAATGLPEIVAAARQLATGKDALARAAGLELLAAVAPPSESFMLARRAVETETDPAALAAAVMALTPLTPPSQAETSAMLVRLVELTRHPDPMVRAHALQQVAEWDKTGDKTTPLVMRAFGDGDVVVRQAAVGAVMLGRLRSDDVKRALLQLIGDPGENMTTRGAGLLALEKFSLSDAEQATYLAQRGDLERRAAARH